MNIKNLSILMLVLLVMSLAVSTTTSAQNYWSASADEEFLFGLGLTVCLIFIIVPLVIAILACIWIYKDAEKRGKSGALWVILLIVATLLFNFLGFIIVIVIWLVVRPPEGSLPQQSGTGSGRVCPNCGRPIPMDAQVCPYCGKDFRLK